MKPFRWDNHEYKDFKFYSFQWGNKKPLIKYAWQENTFKKAMINKYCSVDFETLRKEYTLQYNFEKDEAIVLKEYKKDWLFLAEEIGMDMLEDEYGIITGKRGNEYDNWYIAVPKSNPEMIEYVESIIPKCVKIRTMLK